MEWSKLFIQKMDELKKQNKFWNYDLRRSVYERVSDGLRNETLNEREHEEIFGMYEYLEEVTDDEEYYNCIHCLDDMLKNNGF
jgi:hypothetical protein